MGNYGAAIGKVERSPALSPTASISGAEWIAEFLARVGSDRVFVLTGGAVAFVIDAVARHPDLNFTCFQHEQAAAMAADAIWRVSKKVGVTMATSGPGATNLITGIASSFFDSIPSLHITGQVNQLESAAVLGAKVRQSGFQETDIVAMVKPITKYAVKVGSIEELRRELPKAYAIARSGRMGPVLIDVPMDVQQAMTPPIFDLPNVDERPQPNAADLARLSKTLSDAKRPVVLWGAGIGLAGVESQVTAWLENTGLPFVSSWAGLTYFNNEAPNFLGPIGVYGNRGANFAIQNADAVIVLGSRLDNRQRSGNSANFAIDAEVFAIDVDEQELRKYDGDGYSTLHLDLADLPTILDQLPLPAPSSDWMDYVHLMRNSYKGKETSLSATRLNSLSPYEVIRRFNEVLDEDAIVTADTGASVCWLFQAFSVKKHTLFTSGGNSPMGYALPAAIGAKLEAPGRQIVSINGDGGFQLNLQELQTVAYHDLDIAIVIMNNRSYGIIKQFQDSYLGGRYDASYNGYSAPDFGAIANAYGLAYAKIEQVSDIVPDLLKRGAIIIDVVLSEHTLIEPKLEMGRPINDQFPYISADEYAAGNRFVEYARPDHIQQLALGAGATATAPASQ